MLRKREMYRISNCTVRIRGSVESGGPPDPPPTLASAILAARPPPLIPCGQARFLSVNATPADLGVVMPSGR
jgi:hypothetical protein